MGGIPSSPATRVYSKGGVWLWREIEIGNAKENKGKRNGNMNEVNENV